MPSRAFVGEPIGGGCFDLYLPCRGFSIRVATSPTAPPTRWTGPAPATSTIPNLYKNPLVDQTQWAGIQYINVLRNENTRYASSFVLSAMAPVIEKRHMKNISECCNQMLLQFVNMSKWFFGYFRIEVAPSDNVARMQCTVSGLRSKQIMAHSYA